MSQTPNAHGQQTLTGAEIVVRCLAEEKVDFVFGYPGGAEVVNMQPPAALIKKGITSLPCIGDGRQSGTSGSPSILNASPEAATGGGLAMLKTGDKVRIDLKKRTANILISDEELAERKAAFKAAVQKVWDAWELKPFGAFVKKLRAASN